MRNRGKILFDIFQLLYLHCHSAIAYFLNETSYAFDTIKKNNLLFILLTNCRESCVDWFFLVQIREQTESVENS